MRVLPVLLALVPLPLWADEVVLSTPVTQAAIYLDGALVTRDSTLALQAGDHRIILPDLPRDADPASLSLRLGDTAITAITFRDAFQPPDEVTGDDPALVAAEDRLRAAEAALARYDDAVAEVRARAEAAEALIAYLARVGAGGDGAADPAMLGATAQAIAAETLTARREAIAAMAEARALSASRDRADLVQAVEVARQALDALRAKPGDSLWAVAEVTLAQPYDGPVSVSYIVQNAYWAPTYDLRLSRGDAPALAMDRGAQVAQSSGENWQDVTLTLSTLQLFRPLRSDPPPPRLMRIEDPAPRLPEPLARSYATDAAPAAEPVIVAEAMVATELDGLGVVYAAPGTHDVASGADATRLDLGRVDLTLDRMLAQTVPLMDATAFLMVEATNGDEVILPTYDVRHFVDGLLVGAAEIPHVPANGRMTLGFGPIDGLQVTRRIADRNEGDRGVITRSNEQTEEVVIEVDNLTGRAWDLRVIDRVPYSEQEDLQIAYSAAPQPTVTAFDDRRGVLAWEREIAAGESLRIDLATRITFPTGKELR